MQPPADSGLRAVQALAVANEPEPFWTGDDQADVIEAWKSAIGWTSAWGSAEPAQELNGPSGQWVETQILAPLGYSRSDAWITDCLDTYRTSSGMAAAIESVYQPFATSQDLPAAHLATHPDESAIVREALEGHLARLGSELNEARADLVVTLGNAALRVMARLLDSGQAPKKLSPEDYGGTIAATFQEQEFEWIPLAHPAAPAAYQDAHRQWSLAQRQLG